ncbi:MAG: hypothetical protein QM632_05910 [Micrococcaceae bacterium]
MPENKPQYGVRLEGEELKQHQAEQAQQATAQQTSEDKEQYGVLPLPESNKVVLKPKDNDFATPVTEKATPPQQVKWAWWAWLVTQVVSAISMLYFYLDKFPQFIEQNKATIQQELVSSGENVSLDQLGHTLNSMKPLFIVISLLALALSIFWGYRMFQGKSWARILLTFFLVYQITSILNVFTGFSHDIPAALLTLISAAIAIAIMFWMWCKPAQDYFAAMHNFYIQQKYKRIMK